MKTGVFLLTLLFLASCGTQIEMIKLMKQGDLVQSDVDTQFPFQYSLGLVVFPVEIEGETYQFLLDTGAPNVISTELAEKLALKKAFDKKTGDSQGQKQSLDFLVIDTISFAGMDFVNFGAAVADLKAVNEIRCIGVDGIIGANLMRRAVWKIDYPNQTIRVVSSRTQLQSDSLEFKIPFSPVLTGTPHVAMELNGVKIKDVKLDTGSGGDLSLKSIDLEKIKKKNTQMPTIKSYGTNSAGLFGAGEADTTTTVQIQSLKLGGLEMNNQLIDFDPNGSRLFGTAYFKHFVTTFDWFEKELVLSPRSTPETTEYKTLGFGFGLKEDTLQVRLIVEGSAADSVGLKLGDQILSMDEMDLKSCSFETYCNLIQTKYVKGRDAIILRINRSGELLEFKLKSSVLLD